MTTLYASRTASTFIDGSPIFATDEDRKLEDAVAASMTDKWGCELRRYGVLAPIDWYALRDGRVVGWVEIKCRTHNSDKYPTVFLNLRKLVALLLASAASGGATPVFVVRFADAEIRWVDVRKVPCGEVRLRGCAKIVKAQTDVEPVIEVPLNMMERF